MFDEKKYPPQSEILDGIPPFLQANYQGDFVAADEAYYNGRVAETTQRMNLHWNNKWCPYVGSVGVDPYLQKILFTAQVWFLSGYTAKVRRGHVGQECQVQSGSVSQAPTAVGTTTALASGNNLVKVGALTNLHQD